MLVCAGVPLCLQMHLHVRVDLHAQVVVVQVHACPYVQAGRVHTCVCACTPACVHARQCYGGTRLEKPQGSWRSGFPAPGCACGGLGLAGCSSLQQQQPLPGHKEWGSTCTVP